MNAIPFGTWPDFHPEDPGGFDDWRPGSCDSCEADDVLVRSARCDAHDCTGCRSVCLECEGREWP